MKKPTRAKVLLESLDKKYRLITEPVSQGGHAFEVQKLTEGGWEGVPLDLIPESFHTELFANIKGLHAIVYEGDRGPVYVPARPAAPLATVREEQVWNSCVTEVRRALEAQGFQVQHTPFAD